MSDRSDDARRRAVRFGAAAGLAAGVTLLARPATVARRVAPGFPPERHWIGRVLGARLIAQHALVLVAPEATVVRVAAAIDGLHATSMLPVLTLPRYRRAALVTGGLAAAYALLGPALAPSERG